VAEKLRQKNRGRKITAEKIAKQNRDNKIGNKIAATKSRK
jgi:hypothetical protein